MMEAEHLEHLEHRLLQERERALKALAQFEERVKVTPQEDDGDLTSYPLHPADEGTDTQEQEQTFLLASKEGRLLYSIDDALRTLYKEPARFGLCESCGEMIVFERLDIVPWTRRCVTCQRTEEAAGGELAA